MPREGGDSEDVWRESMEVEDEAESRETLDEQKKKLQKELRDVDRLFLRKCRRASRKSLQHQLQDLIPEHQKAHKRSQKIQGIQDRRRNLQKDSIAAEGEMRKLQQEIRQKEERHLFLSNKIDKSKMQDAEMVAELQSLQAGEERRGSNASQTGDCCLEALWQQFFAMGANGVEAFVQKLQREMGAAQGQMPRREEGRRNSEDEQEQGRTNQQLVLPTPGQSRCTGE